MTADIDPLEAVADYAARQRCLACSAEEEGTAGERRGSNRGVLAQLGGRWAKG